MRYCLSIIALASCASVASAADLGPYGDPYGGSLKDQPVLVVPYNWSGLYFGGHVGWATSDWDVDLSRSQGAIHYNDPFAPAKRSLSSDDSWLGGLQVGFNRQHGSVVWGVEADVSWTDMDASGRFVTATNNTIWDVDTSLELFGTVRGRLGVLVVPHILLYGTAGLAWAQVDMDQATTHLPGNVPGARTSGDANHIGWAAGLGGEWMLASNVSVRAEWLYVDLGDETYGLKGTVAPNNPVPWTESIDADLSFHTVRVGVNYNFGVGR